MKNILFVVLLVIIGGRGIGQTSLKYDIKGIVQDTLENPLIAATVLLLEKSDSTLVDFTRTELDGSFKIKDVKPGNHLIKVTYVGYVPLTTNASAHDGKDLDMGQLQLREIASELMEVIIKAARAPMKMRGDTIEYDASTFVVPEGSSVEDLLRRLPGIEVEQDGSIVSDGKTVDKVTVEGKIFFGADPKAATKNLPAESISKVQVFDTKSEEDKITGSTTESDTKTMNLDLKEGFKSGGFGKVVAGLGTESTAEVKGNYNKFNDKIQFSIVGVGNNTGRNGLNWDDYQDFMGSNSWNFGEGTEYGFGGRGGSYSMSFGGGDDDIESSIQSIFFGNYNSGGFPQNYNGGINFNYDHNKNKLSSVYYYNQASLDKSTESKSKNFYDDFVTTSDSQTDDSDESDGHRAEVTFEKEIDSLNSIVISGDLAAVNIFNTNNGNNSLTRNGSLTTSNEFNNTLDTDGYLVNGEVIYRKKFMKPGRRMGVNASYLYTELDRIGDQQSLITFHADNSTNELDQRTDNLATKNVVKANALFVEPLSSRFFLQTFYNFSQRIEDGDRNVNDISESGNGVLNEFLSRKYNNELSKNRIGSSIRYSYNGLNASIGMAYLTYNLLGDYNTKGNNPTTSMVDKDFDRWIPNVSFSMSPVRNSHLSLSYSLGIAEPSINNLQAIVDNRNPLYLREGNPDLIPSSEHTISTNYRMNFPASAMRFNISASYRYLEDQIINERTIDDNLITTTRPINYSGGRRYSLWSSLNVPIVRNKLSIRTGLSGNVNRSFAFVNDVKNETNTTGLRPNVTLNITPTQDFSIYLSGNYNTTHTEYDISTSEDQTTKNYGYNLELNAKTILGLYVNSNFNFSKYVNDRFDLDQDISIINASIYRQFLPGNVLEARVSVYDALNENLNVSQYAAGNSVYESRTNALGRYIMFSLAYNIRGMKAKTKRGRW